MRGTPAAIIASGLGLGVLAAAPVASAAVSFTTEVSQRKVEVGARFTVRLRAMSDNGEQPTNPELKLPPGITASGPSVGTQSSISIVNGQMTQTVGISATWVLVASRAGTFKLGPASVQTSSGRNGDRPFTIEVVAQGALPPPPLAGQPLDPFDMLRQMNNPGFPGFPGFPGLPQEPQQPEQLPMLPEEYRVERAPDPIAFLRTRPSPRKVVVGEQITLSTYAYAGRGNFEPGLNSEPRRDDFLAFNLMEDARSLQGYQFDLDGQRWITVKISEFALFPLKAGRLKAGEVNFGFVGRGYSTEPKGLVRQAPLIEIEVVEPPLNGRPPGYKLGDVGHYSLDAQLQPREVEAGGSISVVAKLEGVGNLPFTLLVPEQDGVHFLEPQIVDQVAPKRGVVQGFRTFTYVVELTQPGEQDLGELTLPYWDPKARAYGVARAALGKVKVTGTAKPVPASAKPNSGASHLKGLVTPPAKLGPAGAAAPSYWPSRAGYWLLLFGVPLTTALGFALSDLAKLLSKRARERKASLSSALDEALAQLAASARAGDATGSAGPAERALFIAIERATGLKARGVLKAELASALARAEVQSDVAERAARLLDDCDQLRFAGEAVELLSFAAEVREICQKLSMRKVRPAEAVSS
ncbi:MAG TPA: BatD family protein [Polyangiaceae bacterium]|nr:BatD family protein [Polyangiaceae bacterium]